VEEVVVEAKSLPIENEHTWLIFKSGVGGGVSKKSPPSKVSICSSFSKVEAVVVLAKILHPQKRAYAAQLQGWRR
jgi:hypothetical protein